MQVRKWLMLAGAIYLLGMAFIFIRLIKEHRISFRPLVQIGSRIVGGANAADSAPVDWKTVHTKVMEHLQYWQYAKEISYPEREIPWPGSEHWDVNSRYLTFEPDQGGFNNIRMQFEIVIVMCHMLKRTLVLPPKQHYYLIGNDQTMETFYDIEPLKLAMPVITMEEYLKRTGKDKLISNPSNWEDVKKNLRAKNQKDVWHPKYQMWDEILCIPDLNSCKSKTKYNNGLYYPAYELFRANRKEYELPREALNAQTVHVISNQADGYRMFGSWYPFYYFADPQWHWYLMGLIRSKFHYRTFLYEVGAKIINKQVSLLGRYAAIHIRRGDFQYKETRLSADQILTNINPLLMKANETSPFKSLYISSDEKNREFFKPIFDRFGKENVKFLSDYADILAVNDVEEGYHGMIEQIVCSASEIFIGTELSTFSAHITRLRDMMTASFAPNKQVYFTTRQYKGDFSRDNYETLSTWMNDGTPHWPHAVYFRDFFQFLREDFRQPQQ